ncbi:MAG: glycosyltransferase, partial [Candidatus Eremiobacteraeota bacterium]|nr:glycosyltransferase [Candidatus Eremiobacteraeota bacterium]
MTERDTSRSVILSPSTSALRASAQDRQVEGRVRFDIVVPTIGRPSLRELLAALAQGEGPLPESLIVVDDRRDAREPLDLGGLAPAISARLRIVPSGKHATHGPAAARNRGWRAGDAPWISFLDDDVVPSATWLRDLREDLGACEPRCAGSAGNVRVPLPSGRMPTDYERNVHGLEEARYITADCAYRRSALQATGGFDERFRRAYREDADLALHVLASGATIARGRRLVMHPVREADPWISVRLQAGNADDALMARLHGPDWRKRAGATRGRFCDHAITVAFAAFALASAAAWLWKTAAFAFARIAAGPRTFREIATMLITSVAIPFAAVAHRVRGELGARRSTHRRTAAVLFDRDGT